MDLDDALAEFVENRAIPITGFSFLRPGIARQNKGGAI